MKRWQVRRPPAGEVFRLRLPPRAVRPGREARVTVVATRGSRRIRGEILTARRL